VTGALWRQPKMQLQVGDQIEDKNYWGRLVGIDNKFKLGEFISLNASILYKDTGFVEGVVANSGLILEVAFHCIIEDCYFTSLQPQASLSFDLTPQSYGIPL
jgi:hypothetical protein